MLTVIRISDKQKAIGDLIEKDSNAEYHCDYCGNPVVHHKSVSKIKVGHFKHKTGDTHCPNNHESIGI